MILPICRVFIAKPIACHRLKEQKPACVLPRLISRAWAKPAKTGVNKKRGNKHSVATCKSITCPCSLTHFAYTFSPCILRVSLFYQAYTCEELFYESVFQDERDPAVSQILAKWLLGDDFGDLGRCAGTETEVPHLLLLLILTKLFLCSVFLWSTCTVCLAARYNGNIVKLFHVRFMCTCTI